MPQYKVTSKGFFDGKLYDPSGKRTVLTVDKPFKEVPSWLKPMAEPAKSRAKSRAKSAPKTEPSFMEDEASPTNVEVL